MSSSALDTRAEFTRDSALPRQKLEELRLDGWGYKDCGFFLNENQTFEFQGTRYPLKGEVPHLKSYMLETVQASPDNAAPPKVEIKPEHVPKPVKQTDFCNFLDSCSFHFSFCPMERLFRSHGHCVQEIGALRFGILPDRVVDAVLWPSSEEDVVKIVEAAKKFNVCLLPFGGGTNVSLALQMGKEERMLCSVDTSQMNKIVWIDEDNLLARFQSGITGLDLENDLRKRGYTVGHEPDSFEFSTLGGWVSTRASGMKKNTYGNIEDLIVNVTIITPVGKFQKNYQAPRSSVGPDIHHFVLGSEGTLGIVTEVTLKIRPLPQCKKYGALLFRNFEDGVKFMRDVARNRCAPSSIRLVDNEQFRFGMSLKQPVASAFASLKDFINKWYVLKWKSFNENEMTLCTLLFEGDKEDVLVHEKKIRAMSEKYGAIFAGEESGQRGYLLTFLIAYLRDVCLDYHIWAESMETSCPWNRVADLCRNVKERIKLECKIKGIRFTPYVSCRVTQIYDVGACIYIYFGFNGRGLKEPLALYDDIETAAREEILDNGGSLSHHHGVGKLRERWLKKSNGDVGVEMFKAIKKQVDPTNVFSVGNLLTASTSESTETTLTSKSKL
ncbi:alkyldihydroxyacetonephosphate synthase, peroxisomal-like [Convolutriloba macropyga]|uniref:alkyldihydroxyacetonephosphate synthase, peroxisomal-like n=1 Tax=Convolutriloba macropyga TaxID=536237 RepID=UPI003F5204F8